MRGATWTAAAARYEEIAAALARRIRDAAGHDGLKDSRWDRFKGWVADRATAFKFVAEIAGAVGFVAAALSLVLGWVPILGQVLIAVAVIATAVSLIANTMLAMADQGSWLIVGLDLIALASFGAAGLLTRPLARGIVAASRAPSLSVRASTWARQAIGRGVGTPRNSAIFYSGKGSREVAEEAAERTGGRTIESTAGGKWLNDQRLFEPGRGLNRSDAETVWKATSEQYARQASGDVRAYIRDPRPEGVFNSVELPALRDGLATGRIKSITIHDLASGSTRVERFVPSSGQAEASRVATATGAIAVEGVGDP